MFAVKKWWWQELIKWYWWSWSSLCDYDKKRNQRNSIFFIPTQDDGCQRAWRYGKHRLLSSAFLLTGCVSNWSLLHLFHHSCLLHRMMRNMKQNMNCLHCILIYLFICVNILDRQPTSWSRAWQTTVHHPVGRCFFKVGIMCVSNNNITTFQYKAKKITS